MINKTRRRYVSELTTAQKETIQRFCERNFPPAKHYPYEHSHRDVEFYGAEYTYEFERIDLHDRRANMEIACLRRYEEGGEYRWVISMIRDAYGRRRYKLTRYVTGADVNNDLATMAFMLQCN